MIQIIDYGAGNIRSVENALKKLGQKYEFIEKAEELDNAAKVIFPGVGAAGSAMKVLRERGFGEALRNFEGKFLGICLGMQLMTEFSEENDAEGLGIVSGRCQKFPSSVKVPQIGWNKVFFEGEDPIFEGIDSGEYFYFVNSYYAGADGEEVLGRSDYGVTFASVIKCGNFYGCQFHPEKSGEVGLKLLNNFCELC